MPQHTDTAAGKAPAPSAAHAQSAFAVIDPAYSATEVMPKPDLAAESGASWLYGEAELECWRLAVLKQRMKAAELKVGYPGKFHTPESHLQFRCQIAPGASFGKKLSLRAVGEVRVCIGDREVYRGAASDQAHCMAVTDCPPAEARTLTVELLTQTGEPPALLIESGSLATVPGKWQWRGDGTTWSLPALFPQTRSGVPPHKVELPEVTLKPVSQSGEVLDFGRELLGHVVFACSGQPVLDAGESIAEVVKNSPAGLEQSTALVQTADGEWSSKHPLAFRYLRVRGGKAVDIQCRAMFHPARYRGAFSCSDQVLTRIWMNSAYTLRLCMHDFLIDGIKRDRLPWTGDLALSMMANAYSFADAEIVRRSLTALGRAGISELDINGIIDYSLWWIIAQDLYQLYFADQEHLNREWPRVKAALGHLGDRCDDHGLLRVKPETWLFIDWVKAEKLTALQILWWWAQNCGAALAERQGEHSLAEEWRTGAEKLSRTLHSKAWDDKAEAWLGQPDRPAQISRHANLLAVISGLTKVDQGQGIKAALLSHELPAVGTPYMKAFECMALGRLGETAKIISIIRSWWGGMMERGATTFWEAYNPDEQGDQAYAFYGRPFGKSLCHAWSAGPAMLLPATVLGIRPTADGWKRFTVACELAGLASACASVPTPHGDIRVEVDAKQVQIQVPAGTILEYARHSYPGPATVVPDK